MGIRWYSSWRFFPVIFTGREEKNKKGQEKRASRGKRLTRSNFSLFSAYSSCECQWVLIPLVVAALLGKGQLHTVPSLRTTVTQPRKLTHRYRSLCLASCLYIHRLASNTLNTAVTRIPVPFALPKKGWKLLRPHIVTCQWEILMQILPLTPAQCQLALPWIRYLQIPFV